MLEKLKNKFQLLNNHNQQVKAGLLILVFATLALISIYLLSPLNRVHSLKINGNVQIPEEIIVREIQITSDMPLWGTWIDQSYHEGLLVSQLDQIESAEISLDGLQGLSINVSELAVVAQVSGDNGQLVNILENYQSSQSDYPMKASVPLLVGFNSQGDLIEDMVDELADTNLAVLSLMSEIELLAPSRNPRLLQVNMNDGNQVLINIPNFANQINYYPLLKDGVDNQSGIFDLEAGTYFIPYNSEPESEEDQLETDDSDEVEGESLHEGQVETDQE